MQYIVAGVRRGDHRPGHVVCALPPTLLTCCFSFSLIPTFTLIENVCCFFFFFFLVLRLDVCIQITMGTGEEDPSASMLAVGM